MYLKFACRLLRTAEVGTTNQRGTCSAWCVFACLNRRLCRGREKAFHCFLPKDAFLS